MKCLNPLTVDFIRNEMRFTHFYYNKLTTIQMTRWACRAKKCQTTCLGDLETSRSLWQTGGGSASSWDWTSDLISWWVSTTASPIPATPLHCTRLFDLSTCFTLLPIERVINHIGYRNWSRAELVVIYYLCGCRAPPIVA